MNYYVYLILAVACFVGEICIMDFSLACFGMGVMGAALTAWLGFGIWWQVTAFTVVSAVCWTGIRPFTLKYFYGRTKNVKTPAEAVIGQECLVQTEIDPVKGTGRVKVSGESWKATAKEPLAAGTVCIVEKLDGVTLTVRPKN
ncbi:MAG: NfeD family protein [Candidatus Avelusimicrobium sp.]